MQICQLFFFFVAEEVSIGFPFMCWTWSYANGFIKAYVFLIESMAMF